MSVVKAYIAMIKPTSAGEELGRVTFAYNPKEFTYRKSANWPRTPAAGAPAAGRQSFTGADPATVSLEVFLDGYEKGRDVSSDIETLVNCCVPIPGSKPSTPPWVIFGWGTKVHIKAFMKSVDVKCTMFSAEGLPLRAVCNIVMEELAEDLPAQNPTSGGRKTVRSHLVVAGDSLPSIAYRQYGKAGMWRPIAEANDIDDPLRLRPGVHLLVPEPTGLNGGR
jgi:nucleoid-associated protein YgaU